VKLLRNHGPKALLLLLVLYFVAAPLSEDFPRARYLVDGIYVAMLLAALNAGPSRITWRNPMVIAVGISIVLRPLALHFDTQTLWGVVEVYGSVLTFYIAATILKNVTRDSRVSSNTIAGAAAVYILLAVAFASAHHAVALLGDDVEYANLDMSGPHRDQTFQVYYYSVVSQTTLGYGDITPKSNLSRGLTMAQVVFGQLYLAILLARLVGMELAQRRREDPDL
jgi:hypothetical protein